MAPLVDEAVPAIRARLAEIVAPMPGRAAFALRLAVICTLTTLITQTYQLPSQALAAYMVFFLNKPDRVSSILTNVAILLVISFIIGMLIPIAGAVLDQASLRVATMAILSLFLLFLASSSKLKPIGAAMAMIAAFALDRLSGVPGGELATRGLLYTWLAIAVPVAVSIVVNLLIGPAPRNLAERAIAARLYAAADLLDRTGASERARVSALRRQGSAAILGLLRLAAMERTSPRVDIAALGQACRSTDALLTLCNEIDQDSAVPREWRASAADTLRQMAEIITKHRYPLEILPPSEGPVAHRDSTSPFLGDFKSVLAQFAVAQPETGEPNSTPKGGFFLPDAFSNPGHTHYAVKITLAAMGCYLFYSIADWPGIHTCLITCYIVSLGTAAETVEKLSLRIAGCLVGAAAGYVAMVWLTPSIDRITGLLVLVFVGALAGGWVAGGGVRIAYAGFQISFAFFQCIIQGASPDFDLSISRDRIVGILLGNFVVYLVFTRVWPVSVTERIDPALTRLLRQLGLAARIPERTRRRAALPAAHSALSAISSDLDIARYEPSFLRPSSTWFKRHRATLAAVSLVESRLMLINDQATLSAIAARLDQFADAVQLGEEASAGPGSAIPEMQSLEQALAH